MAWRLDAVVMVLDSTPSGWYWEILGNNLDLKKYPLFLLPGVNKIESLVLNTYEKMWLFKS